MDESYLYHEHLEDNNQPIYFHQFVDLAERHGLQYLAEANVSRMLAINLPPGVQEMLREAPAIRREQYLDFVRNVGFRSTLLCHREIELDRQLHDDRMDRFSVQLPAAPDPKEVDLQSHDPVKYTLGECSLTASLPLSKAAIACLGRIWPEAIPVAELYRQARDLLGPVAASDDSSCSIEALYNMLMTALAGDALEVFVHPPRCISAISQRPLAPTLARYQAARRMLIATRWHRYIKLNDLGCFVLQRLDGCRDRAALEADLYEALQNGQIVGDQGEKRPEHSPQEVAEMVDWALGACSAASLLVA